MNLTTSCKDCLWAVYNDKTQVGCEFNKIEQYKLAGKQVIEAYDDDKEFFAINGVCFYGRLPGWGDKDKERLKQELIETFPYQLIFIDYGEHYENKDQFEEIIVEHIKNQSGNMVGVSIIRHKTSLLSVIEMTEILNKHVKKWKIINIEDENQTDDYYITHIIKEIKSTFYAKINNFNHVDDYGKLIYEYMHEKNNKFAILENFDNDLVNCLAHEHYQGGSFGIHLKELVNHRAKEQVQSVQINVP